ncbi:hypothetical protein B484DRAFT_402546 [Ochromonadaceae sp. CCMP2298]|nr:hypothetical protein B484DRAFT_402546 [Ochromonadaceae sp. CCMP2298]|mmetsp:Transcript_15772/g.34888  ORF Transcript_15772/g.34888 Transcript_15772/m.34888 type:complete len:364 (-) Transcript_15772:844-1935(-)
MRCIWIRCLIALSLVVITFQMDFFGGRGNSFPGFRGDGNSMQGSDNEYYDMLGVDRQASDTEIKKAFRKQAMLMHPDKGGDAEQFKLLSEAYEVLSDDKRRQTYDRFGKEGSPAQGGGGGGFSSEFSDLFGSFGRGFSMPLMYTIELSLEDLCTGTSLNVVANGQELLVKIEPGMYEGVELRGQIRDARGGVRDIVFVVQEKEHAVFKRSNADLYMEMKVSLREALMGFERSVAHADGTSFTLRTEEGDISAPDDILVLENLGMPVYSPRAATTPTRGRLFVKVGVEFPRKMWLNASGREELSKLLPGQPGDSPKGKKKGKGAQGAPVVPRKSTLRSFGDYGRPRRSGGGSPSEENFSSFFFR